MKNRVFFIVALCFINLVHGQSKKFNLLIGTFISTSNCDGIYVYDFDSQTGDFNYKSKVAGENPRYLAISRDGNNMYSVNTIRNGGISAFSFDSASGELKFLNRVNSGGDNPCYVSVDNKNKYIFIANYGNGILSAIPLKEDGSLSSDIQIIKQEGSSIDNTRQNEPHVHATVLSPDDRYLLTPNLGTDKVCIYKVDATNISQPLTPADPAFVSVKAGSGPRHITFHPNGKFAYLITELTGNIVAYDYMDGRLTKKQTITMLASGFEGKVGAADIHVSPDGKFLYGSNRGDANDLVIYSINEDGKLNYAGRQSTLGKTPRNFVIDPTGNFLLVANQDSNEIIIFKRDIKTGLLTPTGGKIQVSRPVCMKFVVTN